MNTLNGTSIMVKCPNCGGKFNPEEAIGHEIKEQMERDFQRQLREQSKSIEERIRRQENEKFNLQLKSYERESAFKTERLKVLEEETVLLREKELLVKQKEERMELEMKKRLLEREKVIREQADKSALEKALVEVREREQKLSRDRETMELILKKRVSEEAEKAREEERMKSAELQKKLDDQSRLINEMKRKSEQGSMQMQGEVQELALEEFLKSSFPRDEVEEIGKGKRGGDCVHIVKDQFERICGRILYESKRTKHFSHEWISKIKDDMRLKQADLGVIVTEALPDGMSRFGEVEGIWICTFLEFKALAYLFRLNLSRIGEVMASQENRGEKMNMIYRYVTGVEFRQKLEAAFEAYNEMQEDLTKEKAVMISQWARREKKLLKAVENLVSLYGDVKGIAGGAVQEIKCLEMNEAVALGE
jgi:hypothetical protein